MQHIERDPENPSRVVVSAPLALLIVILLVIDLVAVVATTADRGRFVDRLTMAERTFAAHVLESQEARSELRRRIERLEDKE